MVASETSPFTLLYIFVQVMGLLSFVMHNCTVHLLYIFSMAEISSVISFIHSQLDLFFNGVCVCIFLFCQYFSENS